MILKTLVVGPLQVNCYIVGCEQTKKVAVIDPGDNVDDILMALADQQLKVQYIINTHEHFDHVGGNKRLKEVTGAPLLAHARANEEITHIASKAAVWGMQVDDSPPADWMEEMKALFLAELGVQQAFEDNPLNEDIRDELGDEYRQIISEMVQYIRSNKTTIDDSGLKAWYDKRFGNSVFAFDKMYKLVMDKLKAKSFDEVKEVVLTKKFVEVDG